MNIAIITGASAGLGMEFVRQLDREGLDALWLAARRTDRMTALAAQMKTPCRIFQTDLTDPQSIAILEAALAQTKPVIRFMVNNAGFGKVGFFHEINRQDQLSMIDLNIRALTHLSHLAAAYMTRGSVFMQIASSAGFAPLGGFAVYSATKSYVIHFSMALAAELRPHGIHSIAVCPGSVHTEFSEISRKGTGWQKSAFKRKAEPGPVVSLAIRDAKAKKTLSVYSNSIRLLHIFTRILPRQIIADLSLKHVYRKTTTP